MIFALVVLLGCSSALAQFDGAGAFALKKANGRYYKVPSHISVHGEPLL
jgi:hypothetical protein